MEEIWRDIKDYEGLYQVSNLLNVRSLNYRCTGKIKNLKPSICKGYTMFFLTKDGETKGKTLHRLIAEAFIPNPLNLPEVDHIIPISCGGTNEISNLRWCTHRDNMNNELTVEKESTSNKGRLFSDETRKKLSEALKNKGNKKVYQYTLQGELVKIWDSTIECDRNGYKQANVSACCLGKRNTHRGYKWSYIPL